MLGHIISVECSVTPLILREITDDKMRGQLVLQERIWPIERNFFPLRLANHGDGRSCVGLVVYAVGYQIKNHRLDPLLSTFMRP